MMSNRQILLVAIALGFLGGFSFVALANGSLASEPAIADITN
jgi:hypothetical protein